MMKYLSILFLAPSLALAQAGAPPITRTAPQVEEVISRNTTAPLSPMTIPGLPVPKSPTKPGPSPQPPKPAAVTVTAPRPRAAAPQQVADQQRSPDASQSEAEVLRNLVNQSPSAPRQRLKPPPAEITLRPGVNQQIPIARGAMNRLVTPFANPIAKSADPNITIDYEGPVVYVGTSVDDSVSLFIQEKGSPYSAFALTLLPSDIPAVSVSLRMSGGGDTMMPSALPMNTGKSKSFESDQPFSAAIKTLFRDLALGRVPDGYGLEALNGHHPLMPRCNFGGARVLPMQLVSGHTIIAIVARIENRTYNTITLDERACQSPGVLAVAMYPRIELAPQQMTEVYIALRRPEDVPRSVRPSTIGNR